MPPPGQRQSGILPVKEGWSCPKCGGAHAPDVKTCPRTGETMGDMLRRVNNKPLRFGSTYKEGGPDAGHSAKEGR